MLSDVQTVALIAKMAIRRLVGEWQCAGQRQSSQLQNTRASWSGTVCGFIT